MGPRIRIFAIILALAFISPLALPAQSGNGSSRTLPPMFAGVRLDAPVNYSKLASGDLLHGAVIRDVFSGYHLLIPRGSRASLRVSGMERRRKEHNDQWPWPVSHFRPKYEKFPAFDQLTVSLPDGRTARFHVSLANDYEEVHAPGLPANTSINAGSSTTAKPSAARRKDHGNLNADSTLELVFESYSAESSENPPANVSNSNASDPLPGIETLAAGAETRLALLNGLSASKSQRGKHFQAILAEPLRLNSGEIVPEGSLVEGIVRKRTAPRWLSRSGSLYLAFNRLILPSGKGLSIAASVVGVQASRNSPVKIGQEGGLRGARPGKAQLLVDLGVGFGISKVADDTYQLIAETLISTATDASTAGTARLIGMSLAGLFFIKQQGRDVILPPYTMINIRFDRSPSLQPPDCNNATRNSRRTASGRLCHNPFPACIPDPLAHSGA